MNFTQTNNNKGHVNNMAMSAIQTPADLEQEVSPLVAWARSLSIDTADDYAEAAERLRMIKGTARRVADFFKPMKVRADETKKAILDAEKKLAAPLAESEALAKAAMLTYQQEEQRKADEERRRLQAQADEKARKEREKIEQEQARQRKIEEEARARADAIRKAAEEATAEERRKLLAEADAADRKANSAAAKQDLHAERAASVVAPVVQVEAEIPKVAGQSVRKTWTATVVDLPAFLEFVFANTRADLVLPNEKMLEAIAKGLKQMANIPGVKFEERSTLASSGR